MYKFATVKFDLKSALANLRYTKVVILPACYIINYISVSEFFDALII